MKSIPLEELVYRDGVVKGAPPEKIGLSAFPASDFDYRVGSEQPGASKEIRLDEAFYGESFQGLPPGAAFALARASEGMKAKQIRSQWKKAQKKMTITRGIKLISFD